MPSRNHSPVPAVTTKLHAVNESNENSLTNHNQFHWNNVNHFKNDTIIQDDESIHDRNINDHFY